MLFRIPDKGNSSVIVGKTGHLDKMENILMTDVNLKKII